MLRCCCCAAVLLWLCCCCCLLVLGGVNAQRPFAKLFSSSAIAFTILPVHTYYTVLSTMYKGTEAEAFMVEAMKVAEFCRKGQGDLLHWSAMSWGGTGDRGLASRSFEASHDASSERPREVSLVGTLGSQRE